jgi:hypothetical protein
MQYQRIEYTIVQTANPFGWKWSFEREGRPPKTIVAELLDHDPENWHFL